MGQALPDNEYLAYLRRQAQFAVVPFHQRLAHIYNIMPCLGFRMDLTTGAFEELPIAPEWQDRINRIIEEREIYLRANFPELFDTK